MRRGHRNNATTTTIVGHHHTGALNNWEKNEDLEKAWNIWSNQIEKLDEYAHHIKKSIQIVSQQDIKGPDTIGNLLWVNIYISGYVMHNFVGIVVRRT